MNSVFVDNTADSNGGAIYNGQALDTIIRNCTFARNYGSAGSAIYAVAVGRKAVAFNITMSTISQNSAGVSGAVYVTSTSNLLSLNMADNTW